MLAAIFAFSSIPSTEMPTFGSWDAYVKKGAHAFGYGLLAIAFWRGCEWRKGLLWLPVVLAVLYAAIDEFHQSFVPGRQPSPIDVVIDAIGSSLMLSLWAWLRAARTKTNRRPAQ